MSRISDHRPSFLFLVLCVLSAASSDRPKVLVTNPTIPKIAIDILSEKCNVTVTDDYKRNSILPKLAGMDAILWATKENLDAEVLDKAGPQLKTISSISVGYDNIDVTELKKRGIKLANGRGVPSNAVADTAVLLALAASRRLHEGRLAIETNKWKPGLQWLLGQDLTGSTVGIVGLGNIGQIIAKRLKAFDVGKILYTGHKEKKEGLELGAQFVPLNNLVKESDFVFVSVPLTNETRHMFNDDLFSKFKKTAVFINTSRGGVVDQDALIRALKSEKIFAAGLDVMTPEPLPSNHELLKLPNLVLMPHLGSATIKTRDAMAKLSAGNILRGIAGEELLTPVY